MDGNNENLGSQLIVREYRGADSNSSRDIRNGEYARVTVETTNTAPSASESERLRREIDELQQEIDRRKSQDR